MRARACPVCKECGSKKFKRISVIDDKVVVECLKCSRRMTI